MDSYGKFKIKEYKYWLINIHENQGYLGRCVVWCKRDDALDLLDATDEEKKELFEILERLKRAVNKSFQPDWFNYCFLGNGVRHLHCHFVPRYKEKRELNGFIFKDERWGNSYRTDPDFTISSEILEKIKETIKLCLE